MKLKISYEANDMHLFRRRKTQLQSSRPTPSQRGNKRLRGPVNNKAWRPIRTHPEVNSWQSSSVSSWVDAGRRRSSQWNAGPSGPLRPPESPHSWSPLSGPILHCFTPPLHSATLAFGLRSNSGSIGNSVGPGFLHFFVLLFCCSIARCSPLRSGSGGTRLGPDTSVASGV